jgi:hypothetical protein
MKGNVMSEQRAGRPASAISPPVGAKVSESVEKAPTARLDNRVENAPMPVLDVGKSVQVEKPDAKATAEKTDFKWFKAYIELDSSGEPIVINGQEFHHGQTATVREDLLPVLNEAMFNRKMHEAVTKGQASPVGRRYQGGARR